MLVTVSPSLVNPLRAAHADSHEPHIVIEGGIALDGTVRISGSKNSALALLAGTLLASKGSTTLHNLPKITDITDLVAILNAMGAEAVFSDDGHSLTIDATATSFSEPPPDLVSRMRGSLQLIGPLLARQGLVRLAMPGGCNIGARAVDLHEKGLRGLGATWLIDGGCFYVESGSSGLIGAAVYLDKPSVGATMNTMMAAALADGTTVIDNAAQEPDVVDLAHLINAMGGKVEGHGTSRITIVGQESLTGCDFTVSPDRIEAGTFAIAAVATGGDILLQGADIVALGPVLSKLIDMGAKVEHSEHGVRVTCKQPSGLTGTSIVASPHPGFPTDLQQPFTSLLSIVPGMSSVVDTVYEGRFGHISYLTKMGATLKVEGNVTIVVGTPILHGADVRATDLRAGAALIISALVASGQTRIFDIHHIDRGYQDICSKLRTLGASCKRVNTGDEVTESSTAA